MYYLRGQVDLFLYQLDYEKVKTVVIGEEPRVALDQFLFFPGRVDLRLQDESEDWLTRFVSILALVKTSEQEELLTLMGPGETYKAQIVLWKGGWVKLAVPLKPWPELMEHCKVQGLRIDGDKITELKFVPDAQDGEVDRSTIETHEIVDEHGFQLAINMLSEGSRCGRLGLDQIAAISELIRDGYRSHSEKLLNTKRRSA